MKKILPWFFMSCAVFSANSQEVSDRTQNPPQRQLIRRAEDSSRRFEPFRSIGERGKISSGAGQTSAIQNIGNIYRKPTKEESKILSIDKEDSKKFAQFLREQDTGLTKLISDRGCADYTDVLIASEECLKYTMPGAGASFSFRKGNYSIWQLSDLTYTEDQFFSPGILTHSMLVNIGDLPLEQITLDHQGLKFLKDFEPVTDFEKARETDRKITAGIETDGFVYGRKSRAQENATYVLRVIAYRGNYFRAVDGFVYNELDFDDRRDVTVAFRIIRRDSESVTLLWKMLSNRKSPLIKKPDSDFLKQEENKFTAEKELTNEN